MEAGRVTFRYKDYADDHRTKTMTLDAVEFLRRFVQHILPKGFMKIRHYGLLANGQRQARLTQCRRLLLAAGVAAQGVTAETPGDATIAPAEVRHCAHCGSCRIVVAELPPESGTASAVPDSSCGVLQAAHLKMKSTWSAHASSVRAACKVRANERQPCQRRVTPV